MGECVNFTWCILRLDVKLQGDEEKERGITPLPMMDRDKADQLPESQVGLTLSLRLSLSEMIGWCSMIST